jgi:hypothetical protein
VPACALLSHWLPHTAVCRLTGGQDGRGDRYLGMGEYPTSVGLPTHGREAKEHPRGVPNRPGQLGIARKLGFEAPEGFGAVVVLEAKWHPSATVVPDGKPIGSDDNAPRLCAAPGRPPVVEEKPARCSSSSEQPGKKAVAPDQVVEVPTGRQHGVVLGAPVKVG